MRRLSFVAALLTLAAATACTGKPGPVSPSARPSAAARASKPPVPAAAQALIAKAAAGLTPRTVAQAGTARLVTGTATIIANNGGGIVSDNGGGIISNNTGGIISDNGAGYRVSQAGTAGKPGVFRLADAAVTLHDAQGRLLVDEAGKALAAVTDGHGAFAVEAVLPAGNVVMRIKLWNGGTLQALLTPAAATQAIDTASSLGAAYVLGRYVASQPNPQATLDRLPDAEARRLQAALAEAGKGLTEAPRYEDAALADLTEKLRGQATPVDTALKDIQALLLGQRALGDGRKATETALFNPQALAADATGRVLIAEYSAGRVRALETDGTLTTEIDVARGTRLKQNFLEMSEIQVAADGTLLINSSGVVFGVSPAGAVTKLAGDLQAKGVNGETGDAAQLIASTAVLGPDGTLYAAQEATETAGFALYAVTDGQARRLPGPPSGPGSAVHGVGSALAPDGTLYVLTHDVARPGSGEVLAIPPDRGTCRVVASGLAAGGGARLALMPDGRLAVSENDGQAVAFVSPDGAVAREAYPGTPTGIACTKDGALYAVDARTALVRRRGADGSWAVVAGASALVRANGATQEIVLNGPTGVAFDAEGGLWITERGGGAVRRFQDGAIAPVASYDASEPARRVADFQPQAIVMSGDTAYVASGGTYSRVVALTRAGFQRAVLGSDALLEKQALAVGETVPGTAINLNEIAGVALSPAGELVASVSRTNQVLRLRADGRAEAVVGAVAAPQIGFSAPDYAKLIAAAAVDAGPARTFLLNKPLSVAFDGAGDLLIAETLSMRIRKVAGDGETLSTFAGLDPLAMFGDAFDPATLGDGRAPAASALIAPAALCVDAAGTIYFSEFGTRNSGLIKQYLNGAGLPEGLPDVPARVRKVTKDGVVTTIAGPGARFFADPDAEDALVAPTGLAIAPDGRLAIADSGANLVRILPAGSY